MTVPDTAAETPIIPFGPVLWHPDESHKAALETYAARKRAAEAKGLPSAKATELLLSRAVRMVFNELVPMPREDVVSATEAVETGSGCCLATTKVVTGLLAATGIYPNIFFDGTHFWSGLIDQSGTWTFDSYLSLLSRNGQRSKHVSTNGSVKVCSYGINRSFPAIAMMQPENLTQPHILGQDDDYNWQAEPVDYRMALTAATSEHLPRTSSISLYVPYEMSGIFMRDVCRGFDPEAWSN